MGRAIEDADTQLRAIAAFQLHKSLGLTVLGLSIARLAWRLAHAPPALPATVPPWQRRVAAATHWPFYVLMLAIPFTGWVLVSAQWRDGAALNVPTLWFGWFEVPHLFGLDQSPDGTREMVARNAVRAHSWLAWGAVGLLVLHVGAALKHHFVDRDAVMRSMLPSWRAGEWARAMVVATGMLGVVMAAVAVGVALLRVPVGSLAFKAVDVPVASTAVAPVQARAGQWSFEPAGGRLSFSGVHAGARFGGEFLRWRGTLSFDPDDLGSATLQAQIETDSATTGDVLYDETLPGAEWFDVQRHPTATYRSEKFNKSADGGYAVEGVLAIKGRELPVRLALSFRDAGPEISGHFEIDRREADLGMESDPGAEYISHVVEVSVKATGQ